MENDKKDISGKIIVAMTIGLGIVIAYSCIQSKREQKKPKSNIEQVYSDTLKVDNSAKENLYNIYYVKSK